MLGCDALAEASRGDRQPLQSDDDNRPPPRQVPSVFAFPAALKKLSKNQKNFFAPIVQLCIMPDMKAAPHPSAAPPLAGLLAGMRAETAQLAAQAGIVAMLHALIMSCLTRLVGRLDHLMTLWQAGQLPIPHTGTPHTGTPRPLPAQRRIPAPRFRLSHRPPSAGARIIIGVHIAARSCPTAASRSAIPRSTPPDRVPLHHIRRRKPPWRLLSTAPRIVAPDHALIVLMS